jgi:hypothetical protein
VKALVVKVAVKEKGMIMTWMQSVQGDPSYHLLFKDQGHLSSQCSPYSKGVRRTSRGGKRREVWEVSGGGWTMREGAPASMAALWEEGGTGERDLIHWIVSAGRLQLQTLSWFKLEAEGRI